MIPLPLQYRLALEIGAYRAAATAAIGMIRAGGSEEIWSMRLRGCLRARRREV